MNSIKLYAYIIYKSSDRFLYLLDLIYVRNIARCVLRCVLYTFMFINVWFAHKPMPYVKLYTCVPFRPAVRRQKFLRNRALRVFFFFFLNILKQLSRRALAFSPRHRIKKECTEIFIINSATWIKCVYITMLRWRVFCTRLTYYTGLSLSRIAPNWTNQILYSLLTSREIS